MTKLQVFDGIEEEILNEYQNKMLKILEEDYSNLAKTYELKKENNSIEFLVTEIGLSQNKGVRGRWASFESLSKWAASRGLRTDRQNIDNLRRYLYFRGSDRNKDWISNFFRQVEEI